MGNPTLSFMWSDIVANQKKPNTVEATTALAGPVAEILGVTLWDVRFEKEGGSWYLRFFIDKEGGVDIADCENFSRKIDKLLDEADPIDQSYYLEVCSPGIERELVKPWHFQRYLGSKVFLKLIRPLDGMRDFQGVLEKLEGNQVAIQEEDGTQKTFAMADVAYVKLFDDYDFGEKTK